MELRVLRYFLAAAQEESISAAAEYLHLTQPTLSRQLMDLEAELGKKLFIRGGRRLTLTENGVLFRKRASEILDLVEKAQSEVMESDETVAGDIYIGSGETDGLFLLAQSARALQAQYPGIHYHISSGDNFDVTERLDRGLIDFGVMVDTPPEKYDSLQLPVKDVWGVLMPKEHPLAAKPGICPADLKAQPLIISRHSAPSLDQWMHTPLSQLNVVATYSLLYNASLMVRAGLGLALGLDKLINTTGDSPLCFRPLAPRLELELSIVWKKYQVFSRAADKFLQQLKADLGARRPPPN